MNIDIKWMQKHLDQPIIRDYGDGYTIKQQSPAIECADGSALSVQASRTHYCLPRTNTSPYTHCEIGFPRMVGGMPETLEDEYGDGDGDIYGYVPIELVVDLINAHGGVKGE